MSRTRIERGILAHSGWLIFVLACVSIMLIAWLPVGRGQSSTDENDARRTMLQICAGGFAVLGFYLHFVRIRHSARGEMNARYLKLTELLGSMREGDGASKVPNIETRLCAIYGLGRLGEDSESDYQTIMKALARYIRINARDMDLDPLATLATVEKSSSLRADLQTAMEVLSQLSPHKRTRRPSIDIRGAYLRDLELHNASLDGADLRKAALHAAVLEGVSLKGANLGQAVMDQASLETAIFSESTTFEDADLAGAHFYRAAGPTEAERGLSPDRIAKAVNWGTAAFSDDFVQAVARRCETMPRGAGD